ncbi:MAG: sodium:solute symporter family protein [Hormoscilla sp. GUM202]|nr:sodium:solute symporter family protein [Hormoscilla sp. GUM202]
MSIEYLMPYLAIALYLLGTLWVGLAGYQKEQNTVEGYFLADRKINPIVLFFTLSATNFSAFFFLGFAGSGYRIGLSYYPMMAFDTGMAALGFYYIGYKVWQLGKKKGLITPPELIDVCFHSKALKLLVMAVMVIFTMPYLTLQPIGAGYLLSSLTNGQIPYFLGATLLTLIIVFYVCVGGMKSVALTDIWQGVLMFVLMSAAFGAIANSLGGLATANSNVYEISPELLSRQGVNNFFTQKKLFSYIILWNFALPMLPQMLMRFYAAKNANSLKVSTVFYPIVTTILFICPVMIGMWGHIAFPDLVGKDADRILPMMLEKYAPIWLSSFVMVGALAAFMSTMDSQLLAIGSMLTRDIYISYFRKNASLKEQTLMGRVLIVLAAIVGLILAYKPPASIFAMATQAFTGLSVLFPTVIAALYGKNIHPLSCIISIVAGELVLLGFQLGLIPPSLTFGFLPVVPIVALSALIIVLGNPIINQLQGAQPEP